MSKRIKKFLAASLLVWSFIHPGVSAAPEINKENRWVGYEQLKRACSCESWGDPNKEPRQFHDDGTLIVGQTTPEDKGMCQISTYFHGKEAKRLGIDLTKEDDNLKFAKMLYDREKMAPWGASVRCWKNS